MDRSLLEKYIRLVVREAHQARVPQQLLPVDDKEKSEDVEELDEFSGCGSIAGYTAPLGASREDLIKKKKNDRR